MMPQNALPRPGAGHIRYSRSCPLDSSSSCKGSKLSCNKRTQTESDSPRYFLDFSFVRGLAVARFGLGFKLPFPHLTMALPTTQQLDFVNSWCAKLCIRAGATNILGYGRNDLLFIRIITSLTRRQAIGVDHFYRTMNDQNQSLPAKLETLGGSFGHFLSALSQSRESFYGKRNLVVSLSLSHLFSLAFEYSF
jgi:hypothetical protein